MLTFIMENIWFILAVAVGLGILASVVIANAPMEYPDHESGYVHVGLRVDQLQTLTPVLAKLPFMARVPKQSDSIGTTYHAFTDTEFLLFYGEVVNQGRVVIAEQALRKAAFLPPHAMVFAELIAELRPYRDRLSPEPADYDSRQYYGQPTPLAGMPRSE